DRALARARMPRGPSRRECRWRASLATGRPAPHVHRGSRGLEVVAAAAALVALTPTARQSARPEALEHPVLEGPPRDESELLRADAQRHLGVAAHAVGERDRHLRDVVAVLPDAVAELDLEAVTLGARMRV